MKCFVKINRILGRWELAVYHNSRVFKVWPHSRLIQALDMANQLQLHVDNINDLPITQYCDQSKAGR